MNKELKIRTIYGESYDKFKSIANKETTYLDYDLNIYAKYIIEYIDNLETQLKKQKEVIDNINLIIKGLAYGGSENYYMENFNKINELLKEVSE
jgi:hypothetical protein